MWWDIGKGIHPKLTRADDDKCQYIRGCDLVLLIGKAQQLQAEVAEDVGKSKAVPQKEE